MSYSAHPDTLSGAALPLAARIAKTARSMLKAMQTGQMIAVLRGMSDTQLAQIGISRGQIPDYAKSLIRDE